MKINGTRSAAPKSVRRKSPANGADGARFAAGLSESRASSGPEAAPPADALGGLLALQEVDDPTAERRRGIVRGEALLDSLDQVRLGILAGAIPASQLTALISVLRQKRDRIADPGLAEVLDEIELRAAVELAKLAQAP